MSARITGATSCVWQEAAIFIYFATVQIGSYKPTLNSKPYFQIQLECVDYKDIELYVYINSFKQNWLEFSHKNIILNYLPFPFCTLS